ncbi:MAG TPA: DUF222 domain-containing protein [Acidimicrobiales bacterium]|nr:DUF222 domain-containing protein [Acidimicrobiales bacterium]
MFVSSVAIDDADRAICDLSDEALEEELCAESAHLDAACCRLVLMVAELDRRGVWGQMGLASCAHWLNWRCGVSLGAAREQVRVGRALAGLPLVKAAFGKGELSYSKVRALTRVAEPSTEATLVALAHHATAAQLERIVREYRRADPDEGKRALDRHRGRYLTTATDDQGMVRISARLSPEDGAAVQAALALAQKALAHQHQPSADVSAETSFEGSLADALVMVCESVLARGLGDQSPQAAVVVHVDAQVLEDPANEGCAHAEGTGAVAAHTAHRLACDGTVSHLVFSPAGPVAEAATTRAVPRRLRRAVLARDGGCRWPGCTNRRWVDVHHVVFWANGGKTALSNLVTVCRRHHRLVHEGGYRLQMARPGKVCVHRPDGTEIPQVPATPPVKGPGLAERQWLAKVVGEPDPDVVRGERFDLPMTVDGLLWDKWRGKGAGGP